jgi:ribonuclease-3
MELNALSKTLGVEVDQDLLLQALTHSSYAYEHPESGIPNNERLEFLGDLVLGFIVGEHVFNIFPDVNEGELSRRKHFVVSEKVLAAAATNMGLGQHIRLGKGAEKDRNRPSILCDAFESVLAAAYLTSGLDSAYTIVSRHIFPYLNDPRAVFLASDPKGYLEELIKEKNLGPVAYEVTSTGPAHAKVFTATVTIGDQVFGVVEGKTQRHAQANAARAAVDKLQEHEPNA